MLKLNEPITTFYENLQRQGAAFSIDDGKLTVTLPDALKSNTYMKEEIAKRAQWLIELAEMETLIGRTHAPDDAERLRMLAAKYGYSVQWERIPLYGEGVADDDPQR